MTRIVRVALVSFVAFSLSFAAPALFADSVLFKDGRYFEVPRLEVAEKSVTAHFKYGSIAIDKALLQDWFTMTAAGDFEPRNDEEKAKVEKGLVPFDGKWITKAQRDESKANVTWATNEQRRAEELLQQGIGSERDVERARIDFDAAKARLAAQEAAVVASATAIDAARQRVQVAAAELRVAEAQATAAAAAHDLARATLDKTDVRAPFDGIVVLKDAEVGEVVSPNSQGGSNARGAVCTMVDFDSLEVQANVPETALASVKLGAPADVFLDAFPDDRYAGVVDRIWPTADRQKATVEVRVRLDKRDARLRPEMGVRIVFRQGGGGAAVADAAASKRTILVPEQAIVDQGGKTLAFVLERDTVRVAVVTAGQRKNGRVAIESGLVPGQRIVLDPPASLQDGSRVRLADN